MKVLTAAQMGAVDRATIESGIPGLILMENAAHRCVEFLAAKFGPLDAHRIVIVCGKGNNGGDGLAIARQIFTRFRPREFRVVLIAEASELTGDAALNYQMLLAAGLQVYWDFGPEMRTATLVIDAVLGTGLKGAAKGAALSAIREINTTFPLAKVFSVDIPSGLSGDSGAIAGEFVRADATVTFTAPKLCHALPPASHCMGELVVAPIGSPAALFEDDPSISLSLITPADIASLFAPRLRDSNKGRYGHVLMIAGARGKTGAAVMAGLSALRAGAGLVTVACPEESIDAVAAHAPEVMTEALRNPREQAETRSMVAIGPGLGTADATRAMVRQLFADLPKPMVVDADALNCIASTDWKRGEHLRVLTPHPGEMSRLTGLTVAEVQADRIQVARSLATERGVVVVLKGDGSLIAFPDGRVWINPTGSPAMATGGTGDILTGMVAGLLAQFPADPDRAIAGAVYLHGLLGEIAARELGEQAVIATDLLRFLGEGIREIRNLPH
jgi:NAD(P)H-hydrate epimerase